MSGQVRIYPCEICGAPMPLRRWLTELLCEACQSVESLDRKAIAAGIVDPAKLEDLKKRERKQ